MRAGNARLCPNALLFRVNSADIKTQVRPATLASSPVAFWGSVTSVGKVLTIHEIDPTEPI